MLAYANTSGSVCNSHTGIMSTQQAKIFMTSSFISITGQSLELGSEAENQGQFVATSGQAIGSPLTSALYRTMHANKLL